LTVKFVRTETLIWTLNRLVPIEVHYMEKNPGMFSSKTLIPFRLKKDMDILDDMGVFLKVNYSQINVIFSYF